MSILKTTEVNQVLLVLEVAAVWPGASTPWARSSWTWTWSHLNKSRYLLHRTALCSTHTSYTTYIFFQLQAQGLVPILAHPSSCGGSGKSLLVRVCRAGEWHHASQCGPVSWPLWCFQVKAGGYLGGEKFNSFSGYRQPSPFKMQLSSSNSMMILGWTDCSQLTPLGNKHFMNSLGPPAESKPKVYPFPEEALGALFTCFR